MHFSVSCLIVCDWKAWRKELLLLYCYRSPIPIMSISCKNVPPLSTSPCFASLSGFSFSAGVCLWRTQSSVTKRNVTVKFAPLALRWTLHAQIISTCKRPSPSFFIWKGKLCFFGPGSVVLNFNLWNSERLCQVQGNGGNVVKVYDLERLFDIDWLKKFVL